MMLFYTLSLTMFLNVYVAMYYLSMVLLFFLMASGPLYGTSWDAMPRTVRIFLVQLYVVPWIPPVPVGVDRSLHPYTLVLLGLGVYQIWQALPATSRSGPAPAHEELTPK
jgi:hypothetical protein